MRLRPYQLAAVQRIREQIRAGRKNILVVAPTGAGKTVIGAHILHQVDEKFSRGLFVAHRREIIHQTSEKLDAFGCPHAIFMSGHRPSAFSNIQVVSIQTFQARKRAEKHIPPLADVIMIDEAHRSVAKGYQELRNHYPDAILIGLTATPIRGDGRGLGGMYDAMIEVESVQGLIDRGFLVNTRIVAPTMPDLTGVRTRGGDYVEEDLEKLMDKATLVGNVVEEWKSLAHDRKTVVFSSGVGHSKHLCEAFRAAGYGRSTSTGRRPAT